MKNLNDIFPGMDDVINNAKKNNNLEDVLNKTRSYARKSAEALEISRKRIEYFESKARLSKAYENYGKLCYAANEGETVDQSEFDSAVDEITLLKNRMDFLKDEIDALKAEIAASIDAVMNVGKKGDVVVEDIEVVEEPSD